MAFAVVWMVTDMLGGSSYGIITNPGYLVPADGTALAPMFGNTGQGLQAASLTFVPEPSTYALIIGVSALGLVYWRKKRRQAVDVEEA